MSRDFILVALALICWGFGEGMFFYFQPIYLEKLGASPIGIGAILGGLGTAMTIAHIPAGYLADRLGRRPLMWLSWTIALTAAWIMALSNSLNIFVLGLMLYGITGSVISVINSYITAARGKLSVARVITLITAAYSFGSILGPWVGGIIGDRAGLRQVYLVAACTFILSTLIIYSIRPQPVEHVDHSQKKFILPFNYHFYRYLGVVFLVIFALYLPQPLSSNYLENERSLSLGQIGQLGSIAGIGIVIISLLLGNLHTRTGFLLAQASVGFFAFFLWKGTNFTWYALGYLLLGGFKVVRSFATAQTQSLVNQSNMGLAYGITETAASIPITLAPPLAGILYQIQPNIIYPISLLLIIASLLLSIFFIPSAQSTSAIEIQSINKTE
jgi:predicted MFS family arabinose efflux permease